mgnify:CR=1 FL=1
MGNETKIITGESGKELIVTRIFDAPVNKVWHAWTDSAEPVSYTHLTLPTKA